MEDLRFLVVKRRGPGEWLIKLPWAPWRFRPAQLERQDLLSKMFADKAVGLFLIDPDDRENVSEAIVTIDRPSDESSQWLFVRAERIGRAATDLHTGNWVLFPLDGIPGEPLPPPSHRDDAMNSVTGMMRVLGAKTCVLSSEDDIEWTIVESASDGNEPAGLGNS